MKYSLPNFLLGSPSLIIILLSAFTNRSLAQSYCVPKYNFVDCNTLQHRNYIYNVSLNNRTFSTSCSSAGYAGLVNQTSSGVSDPIVLTTSGYYTMTVNTYDYDSKTYSSYYNQTYYAVWIDYNSNGTFDADERIKYDNASTFSFTVRSGVAGNYRMRIRTQNNDPCSAQDYGETEDYQLQIIPPPPYVINDQGTTYCAGTSYSLTAAFCDGGTIRWYDSYKRYVGDNGISVPLKSYITGSTNSSTGANYYSTVFYTNCTINNVVSNFASITVNFWQPTPPTISSNNYNLTVGQTATLTATGCPSTFPVYWSTGQFDSQITVTPTKTTNYTATCTTSGHGPVRGCGSDPSNTATITVNAPSAPGIVATKSLICPGESVILTASNCLGSIKWSTGATTSSITVNPTQNTDYSASCVINGVEGVKATTTVAVNPSTTITTQPSQAVVCEGGQATFSIGATGSGIISYSWTKNGQVLTDSSAITPQLTLSKVTAANNGSYQVKVSGACGTAQSNAVTLQVSPRLSATVSVQAANCNGNADGSLTISASGGLDNKQYRITNQTDFQSSNAFTGLRAGTYSVQVRDQAGCSTDIQAEIKQPDRIMFTLTAPTNAKCAGGSDGAVNVQATGGNGSFKYAINGGTDQTSGQFQGLKANTNYIIKATDGKGCSETTNAYVGSPNQIVVNSIPSAVLCSGGSTGKISVGASGGNGSYQYQLDQNTYQPTNIFSDLKAGTYTITVKDDNGCSGTASVSIGEPAPVVVSATSTLVSCLNDSSASITTLATGGVGPYQYQIATKTPQSGNIFANVRAGSFQVTVKDANGCSANTTVTVKKADPIIVQTTMQAASCCTCADGSIALTSSGGIGQKQFTLQETGFQTGSTFSRLTPGQYHIIARDEAGCPSSLTLTVTNATAATLTLSNVKNVNCAGGHDGAATVNVSGSQSGYTYAWQTKNPSDSLGTGATVTRLPEGEYSVTATDANRCTSTISGTLTAQNPLPAKPTVTQSSGSLVSSASSGVQWYSGLDLKTGKLIPNATQAIYVPYQSNSYFVVVTLNGCSSPASSAFAFVLLGIEASSSLRLRILPNPVTEKLRVEFDQDERAAIQLQLLDLTGKPVLNVQTPVFSGKQQFEWPLQAASSGVYLLRAEAGNRVETQRVIIH